jgi:predicted transcriptional regulator
MLNKTAFQTLEEVDAYLSGNTVECLVCGKRFNLLNKHLSEKHRLSTDEYRAQFGIPFDRELTSAQLRAKVQQRLEQRSTGNRLASLSMSVQPFQTMSEVDNYLSGNKIQCLLCGKNYRALTAQHIELHGLSHDEYRVKFGIPYGRSLTSAPTRDKCRANVTPELVETLLREQAQYVASRRGLPLIATPPKPVAPAVTDLWRKQGRKGLLISQTPITTKCAICGCDYVTTLSISTRPVRCMNCAPTWTKTTRDNYWRKKLGSAYVPMHEKKMPEREPFRTREQVDEYLSGDSVQCLICGRRFNGLHMHLKFKHGITDDDYRQRYGIPLSRSLTSVTYRAKATAGQAATVACANCGDEVVTSKYHASKDLLCLKCDVSAKGKARASYWRNKIKTVPAPLTASELAALDTPFRTPEAVDAYLSGNTVACLICGEHKSSLPLHLHRAHNMAPDDYRRRFGIPLTRALLAAPLRDALASAMTGERLERFKRASEGMRQRGLHKETNPLGSKLVAPINRWRYKRVA